MGFDVDKWLAPTRACRKVIYQFVSERAARPLPWGLFAEPKLLDNVEVLLTLMHF
jgi:hypothetical protein